MIIGIIYFILAIVSYSITSKLDALFRDLNIIIPTMTIILLKGKVVISVCLTALGLYCIFDKRATDGVMVIHIGLIMAMMVGYVVVMGSPILFVVQQLSSP